MNRHHISVVGRVFENLPKEQETGHLRVIRWLY